jgi:hypothetical protein
MKSFSTQPQTSMGVARPAPRGLLPVLVSPVWLRLHASPHLVPVAAYGQRDAILQMPTMQRSGDVPFRRFVAGNVPGVISEAEVREQADMTSCVRNDPCAVTAIRSCGTRWLSADAAPEPTRGALSKTIPSNDARAQVGLETALPISLLPTGGDRKISRQRTCGRGPLG